MFINNLHTTGSTQEDSTHRSYVNSTPFSVADLSIRSLWFAGVLKSIPIHPHWTKDTKDKSMSHYVRPCCVSISKKTQKSQPGGCVRWVKLYRVDEMWVERALHATGRRGNCAAAMGTTSCHCLGRRAVRPLSAGPGEHPQGWQRRQTWSPGRSGTRTLGGLQAISSPPRKPRLARGWIRASACELLSNTRHVPVWNFTRSWR